MGEVISSLDNTQLYLNREVEKGYRAVTVIVHGFCGHQGRYDYFAELLHKAEIRTYRFDHRGYGCLEGEQTYYGDFNELLDDINTVMDMTIAENPDVPVSLIGHSMDGFTTASYGVKYSGKKLRGIITSGTLTMDNGRLITSVPKNLDIRTRLPNELGAGVCSVTEVVDWYGGDPYSTKTFTTGLCYALCDGIGQFAGKKKELRYPALMLHGEKGDLINVQDIYNFFKATASADKQMKIYDGLFHETFNKCCKDEAIGDAIRWVGNRIG